MSKHLVIVESPAKAKSINKILGKDFVVKASLGHVRDLPQKKLGVDIDKNFKPAYELLPGRKKTVQELQKIAATAEKIFLAPDPDREGEAIAWHLRHALGKGKDDEQFYRVTYNEITAPAIRRAFENPTRIDMHKVDAQQARRVLDRIVGYQVSPLLWRRIRGGSSAGRVQSVALRLLCEREAEIRKFVPEEYWVMGAQVAKQQPPKDPFRIKLAKIDGNDPDIKNAEQAGRIKADLETRTLTVASIQEREITRRTRPPFITSTLQQAASSFLGYSPSRTMSIAQKLYEGPGAGEDAGGLITYMRTDSPSISQEAQQACRAFVEKQFGADYLPEKPNFFKGKSSAQEAHEAIRPTDVNRTPDSLAQILKPEELKLYRMIWQRFVASQMAPAKIAQRTVEVDARPGAETQAGDRMTYLFRVTASVVTFPGFMKVTGEDVKKKKAASDENSEDADNDVDELPPLAEGEELDCLEWLQEQKFTKPPARFSEASLVRTLEENGVGRPSTYAQTIQTLYNRKYVEKEKSALKPTDTGERVNEFLVGHLNELFDVGFTANMEKSLDDVEEGRVEWTGMMRDFYETFLTWIAKAKGPDADQGVARMLIEYVQNVNTWDAPVKRGKRTYSDEDFVMSVVKQLDDGEKHITQRQVDALVGMIFKYREQLPDAEAFVRGLGLDALWDKVSRPKEPPRQTTLEKMDVLKNVKFDPPRQVGKRTYDDAEFCQSLRAQVEGGKRLSENQVMYLDRLVVKYAKQIPEYERLAEEWGLGKEEPVNIAEIKPLLDVLEGVSDWKPPVQRGKRTWDDKEFYQSLAKQFADKGTLSPKQLASLKKMAARYSGGGKEKAAAS